MQEYELKPVLFLLMLSGKKNLIPVLPAKETNIAGIMNALFFSLRAKNGKSSANLRKAEALSLKSDIVIAWRSIRKNLRARTGFYNVTFFTVTVILTSNIV